MYIIKTKQGLGFRMLNNWLDCPHREYCPKREEREENLLRHRCSFNPSIFKCEGYKNFNQQLGIEDIKDIRFL
jgi:hypothetical protein